LIAKTEPKSIITIILNAISKHRTVYPADLVNELKELQNKKKMEETIVLHVL